MVSRCSPVWVEARGTSTAQNQLQLLKDSFINHRNFWLERRLLLSLPRVCDLPRSGAVCKRNSLDNSHIGIGL